MASTAGVLDSRGHDVVALAEARERDSRDREVVGLAAARREHDAFGVAAEQCGELSARPRDRIAASTSGAIGVVALWSR